MRLKLKPGESINDENLQDSHLNIICNNEQRTSSMNSFVDVHTPSESPEASSSESSTGGDWESGELFKTNEHVDWPKQRTVTFSKQKLAINKSNISTNTTTITTSTISTATAKLSQHHFKSKSNSIKILNNNNKDNMKKMRWLSNMRSDPDFRETFIKSVNIQPRQSIDSLDMDYYSTICDNQLSLGSPYKSPCNLNKSILHANRSQHMHNNDNEAACSIAIASIANENKSNHINNNNHVDDGHDDVDCSTTVLVVAKPVESQSIGFNVVDNCNENASAKHHCDSSSSNSNSNRQQFAETAFNRSEDVDDKPSKNQMNKFNQPNKVPVSRQKPQQIESIDTSSPKYKTNVATDANSSSAAVKCSINTNLSLAAPITKKLPFVQIKTENKKNVSTNRLEADSNIVSSTPSSPYESVSCKSNSEQIFASTSTNTPSTSSTSSSSLLIRKRGNRYPPFTFREIRKELRSVMRQNSIKKF